MKQYLVRGFTAILLSFCIVLLGCSFATAQTTVNIIGSVIAIAQADLPSLEATGIIPLPDQLAVNAILALASALDKQAATCITQDQAAGNLKSAFAACFETFASSFASSSELAALHILSPSAQKQTQIWVAAIQTALFSVIVAFGGTVPLAAASNNVITSPEYKAFEARVKADHKAHPHRVL